MSLKSDLSLSAEKFSEAAIPDDAQKLNKQLIDVMDGIPKWYEVGAERYRQMRWNNETPLPRPPTLDTGINFTLPSRDQGRDIPMRMFKPADGKVQGVFYHIHGGGWTLQSELYQDGYLDSLSKLGYVVVSVGYRLAPEHPFPAGPEDCYDVADYLVANAEQEYGGPLLFIGGESAGAHLTVLTWLHLHTRHQSFTLPPQGGLVLNYGCYDLSNFLPSAQHFDTPLIINYDIMVAYRDAFLPNTTATQRCQPTISPFFADWKLLAKEARSRGARNGLPRALFTVGTEDPLVDDSVLMCTKWVMAGGEGILKVYAGAAHGFSMFDPKSLTSAGEVKQDIAAFLKG